MKSLRKRFRDVTWLKISSPDFGYTNESHEAERQDMDMVGISKQAWIAHGCLSTTSAKIHADPRWGAFLRKIGYAPEQLAKIEFNVMSPQAEGATAKGGANH
jgi:hypothetical protein